MFFSVDSEFFVERQVFFNIKLDIILSSDPKDKKYHYFLACLQNITITTKKEEDYLPFLEVIFLSDMVGRFFYRVQFESYDHITSDRWKKIKLCVDNELIRFSNEKCNDPDGRIFFPVQVDEKESISKSEEIHKKLECAYEIEKQYHELCKQLKTLFSKKTPNHDIAAKYNISEEDIKIQFYSGERPKISELAKIILTSRNSPMNYFTKQLGIVTPRQLDDLILHRHRKGSDGKIELDYYPKLKKIITGKRKYMKRSEEEIRRIMTDTSLK
ncbi:MAG: hypothetical protein ABFD98_05515 [Syntrophobacteraceae bacterium]